jgi:transposase-like protein
MPICPECYSRDLVKFGTYHNKQKWHCWSCGLTTIHVLRRMPSSKARIRKLRKER